MNSQDQSISALRDTGRRAYECGDLPRAFDIARQCTKIDPDDPRTQELMGLIQFSMGCYKSSVALLESASLLVPLSNPAQVCLAHGYGRIGRRDLSRELLLNLMRTGHISVSLLLTIGSGLDDLGYPDLAMQAAEQAGRRDPEEAQAWYDYGYYVGRCGGPEPKVEACARKAIQLEPGNLRYRVGLAGLLVKSGRDGEAIELIRHFSNDAIESIGCANCLQRVASLYERAGDYRRLVVARQRLALIDEGDRTADDC